MNNGIQKQIYFRKKIQNLPLCYWPLRKTLSCLQVTCTSMFKYNVKDNPSSFLSGLILGTVIATSRASSFPLTFLLDKQRWTIFNNISTCESKFADLLHYCLRKLQTNWIVFSLELRRRDPRQKKTDKLICLHFVVLFFFSRYLRHLPFLMWNTNSTKHVSTTAAGWRHG